MARLLLRGVALVWVIAIWLAFIVWAFDLPRPPVLSAGIVVGGVSFLISEFLTWVDRQEWAGKP